MMDQLAESAAGVDDNDQPEPGDADGFIERGVARLDGREPGLAVEDFDAAVRLDPADSKAYFNRGRARLALGDYALAIRDFDEALRLAPENAYALSFRAAARHHQGDDSGAFADYDRAIALSPGAASLYCGRGALLHSLEDYRAAVADYTRAIALEPNAAEAYRSRGLARYADDDWTAAIADFSEAIRLRPEDARIYLHRAYARQAAEDDEGTLADYGEALRLDPKLADAYRGRAGILEALGRDEEADADHEKAERLDDEKPSGEDAMTERTAQIDVLIRSHFEPTPSGDLTITERVFPHRVRADLQRAVDRAFGGETTVSFFCGVRKRYNHEGIGFNDLLIKDRNEPAVLVPPMYEEVDVGGDEPVRCLKNGLWLLEADGVRFAVFLEQHSHFGRMERLRIQVATTNDPPGFQVAQGFFRRLEEAVQCAESYRGKILSLEADEHYTGRSSGVRVHKLAHVERDQVILPARTLDLLERNVIRFVGLRPRLNGLGLATKKGLLFYGPPGTGKTHTIHYLAAALPGHTTLLITAEQVGLLDEYMTLARLLQPSVVVIEDVDLIARDRTTMDSPCEEVLLNKLLNEMDGLRPDAEILFVLTTNRPEALESALASRPGRVDQVIEFPLPDEAGRAKLVRLYARGMEVPEDVLRASVKRTEGVSASFIKELMRRSAQFHLERDGSGSLALEDVESALDELLFSGGTLNRKLLGGFLGEPGASCSPGA
ncbi:tetratricopeptide repeat protein [Paludisphaera borealis]|uniref:ATP-dependent zinc metalloprotease FtsH 3 n=1 Tax=Paludisphaera borealis TaxID=1387353 RepID=A0A1U7CY68_9BACT|nr:tetratricopeptide repeat protein [Paludisphaera borealis]APW63861.1 ATP-dependent zinc metalloprotease FtsH 3 [Paludisphaera borealis]